jgi:hypothetical protein
VEPVVPPAIRERFEYELDFPNTSDDAEQERISDIMYLRAQALQRACSIAGQNLSIAQQRDTLRYAHTRSGQYKPRVLRFQPGDYVYLRRGNKASTLQMGVYDDIYRIVGINSDGIATLKGRCGSEMRHHVERLQPCHLTDIDPRIDTRLRHKQSEVACEVCGESQDSQDLLSCGYCGTWYHTYCLQPPLGRLPKHGWLCDACKSKGVTEAMAQLSTEPVLPPKAPTIFLSAAQRKRVRECKALDGRQVWSEFTQNKITKPYWGTAKYLGPEAGTKCFEVTFQDGSTWKYTLAELKALPEEEPTQYRQRSAAQTAGEQSPAGMGRPSGHKSVSTLGQAASLAWAAICYQATC